MVDGLPTMTKEYKENIYKDYCSKNYKKVMFRILSDDQDLCGTPAKNNSGKCVVKTDIKSCEDSSLINFD